MSGFKLRQRFIKQAFSGFADLQIGGAAISEIALLRDATAACELSKGGLVLCVV